MNREASKFLAGSFAGLAYAHAAYAVAASQGIISEPIFLGRKWGVGHLWTEAAVYTAVSLALAYFGWSSKPQELQLPRASATAGQGSQDAAASQEVSPLAARQMG